MTRRNNEIYMRKIFYSFNLIGHNITMVTYPTDFSLTLSPKYNKLTDLNNTQLST